MDAEPDPWPVCTVAHWTGESWNILCTVLSSAVDNMHTAGHTHAVYTAHVNTDRIYTHMTHTLKGINQTLTQEVICKALGRGELYIFTFMWQEALLNINVNGLGREMSLSLFCFCVAFFTIYDHMALLLFDIHQLTHIFPSTNPPAWTCKT